MNFRSCLLVVALCLAAAPVSAERVLFVPLDDRPVCLAYPTAAFQAAGLDVVTPPPELIASRWHPGDPDGLLNWLESEAPGAASAVVASDSVLYGGLVPSRTHHESLDKIEARLARFNRLAEGSLPLRLYVFSTVMRTPRMSAGNVEPPYYEAWGPSLFRLSALTDKGAQTALTVAEKNEQTSLQTNIPGDVLQDWQARREINARINERLLSSMAAGKYAYFVLGRDDTAPYSQSRREFRALSKEAAKLPASQYRSFAGTDEVGWVLLLRAKNDLEQQLPFVSVKYAPGAGAATVASYEDESIGSSVQNHLMAAGALPVSGRADLLLAVNTPYSGKTLEASEGLKQLPRKMDPVWLAFLRQAAMGATPVALADVAYGNGGDDVLVRALAKEGAAQKMAAYGGWNTAGNTIGSTLVQGILAKSQPPQEQRRQLTVRYLEDWGYQTLVRQELSATFVWPQGWNGSQLTSAQRVELEMRGSMWLQTLADAYHLLPAGGADSVKMTLPWDRMFEAYVTVQQGK